MSDSDAGRPDDAADLRQDAGPEADGPELTGKGGAGQARARLPEDPEPDPRRPVPQDFPGEPKVRRRLGPEPSPKEPRPESWFSRHWVITLVVGMLLLVVAGSLYVSHGMY